MAHRAKHRQAAAMRRQADESKKPEPAQRQPPGTGSPGLPVSRFLRGGVK